MEYFHCYYFFKQKGDGYSLEESDSSSVIVNLKDKAKLYTADIKTIYDSNSDLTFVQFYFSGNYPYNYPDSEKKL